MSENNRMTSVPDFLSELDAGVFENKLSAALNDVAFGTNKNGGTGEVHIILKFTQADEDRLKVSHKLKFVTPTKRGKTEEDTTETPMWVGKGGKLILPEDQGQLFGIDGSVDGKLKAVK
ncbi:hypothetical protein [Morganella morganii]|uniref:hypothetical protein n=1 Tax=Morganella morganii TaxID=582 RepID=UPI00197BA769|nr:hypothetical protein [Morganella morganii]MBN4020354.1 hypothetical protein [Morganella morganii]